MFLFLLISNLGLSMEEFCFFTLLLNLALKVAEEQSFMNIVEL